MENNNRTLGSDRMPASKFEELLNKPIQSEDDYFDYVKALYDEWHDRDVNNYPAFNKLNTDMKILERDLPPQFFTGDIKSSVVMISLNGHSGEQRSEIDATTHCDTWEEYKDYWINFVMKRYGDNSKYKDNPVSDFDAKLHHFLSGSNAEVASEDLAKWNFFHMELFPFLSGRCPTMNKIVLGIMKKYLLRALEAIALQKREIVLVLNKPVCRILDSISRSKDNIVVTIEEHPKIAITEKFKAKRIDYQVQLNYLKNASIDIVAVPTFASYAMMGGCLEKYNKEAFEDSECRILKKAIGIK